MVWYYVIRVSTNFIIQRENTLEKARKHVLYLSKKDNKLYGIAKELETYRFGKEVK